jgi:hypothetical protein
MNSSSPDRQPRALRRLGLALAPVAVAAALLAGCAAGQVGNPSTVKPSAGQRYHCEQGIEFGVKFVDDSALIDSNRSHNLLFRDAGGQGEGQTVYSNAEVRAEFGLGASGREARLSYLLPPLVVRCQPD